MLPTPPPLPPLSLPLDAAIARRLRDPPPARGAEEAFLPSEFPEDLLLACCVDGGGQNAYACTEYAAAGRLHSRALVLATRYLQSQPAACRGRGPRGGRAGDAYRVDAYRTDAVLLQARALDGLGRVAREAGR